MKTNVNIEAESPLSFKSRENDSGLIIDSEPCEILPPKCRSSSASHLSICHHFKLRVALTLSNRISPIGNISPPPFKIFKNKNSKMFNISLMS